MKTGAGAARDAVSLRLEGREGAGPVAELVLEDPERSVNVLSLAVVDQIDAALDRLGREGEVRALVVRSAREACFVAGADLREIAAVEEASIAIAHAARVQSLFQRLAELRFPVVAAIQGSCLGGGLELALACRVRVAADDGGTRLGLPEVKLGIIPGFGGTQRLPRLVGLRRALPLILKGYTVSAREALAAGLVDAVLPAEGFAERVRALVRDMLRGARSPRGARPGWIDRALLGVGPLRDLYLLAAERAVRRETRGMYPAPLGAITSLREGLRSSLDRGLEIEAGVVGALAVSPECKSLIRLHFAGEALRKNPPVDLALARPVRKLAVAGAGAMGSGVAALAARSGIPVRLRDVSHQALGRGLAQVDREVKEAARRGRAPRGAAGEWSRRVSATTEPRGFRSAELVLEAVVEDLPLKLAVLEELEGVMAPDAVYASNTSALSISEIARSARQPGRVVGMHFFNPVAKMALVEVVRGDQSTEAALATATKLALDLGKVPVVVADGPGFLVNRLLAPYLGEALRMVMEGADLAALERAMLDFGMPMGPLELLDEVGLDVARHVSATLQEAFPERLAPSPVLDGLVELGRLGRKSGRGFYRHRGRRRSLDPDLARVLGRLGVRRLREPLTRGAVQERLILVMLNEACRALEEGVVATPGEVDLALVLGTGFPPYRGGLLAFGATLGVDVVIQSLERLEGRHGERFRPAPLLGALESRGKGFLEAREVLGAGTGQAPCRDSGGPGRESDGRA